MNFQEAIEKMKKGYIIKRFGSRWKSYKKGKIEIKGKITDVFGYVDSEGKFNDGGSFYMEDILATDWIIENEGKRHLKLIEKEVK